jgi:hypothetical protein
MAPAEALCSGLPLFLTNWGGFMDFNLNLPNQVTLTDVNICKDMIKPIKGTKQKLFEFICRYKAQNFSQNSLDAKGIYSTDAIAKKISKLLQEDVEMFAGFNQYFDEMSQVPLAQFPFNNDQNEFNNKYEQLYDCYFNQGQS